MLLRRRQQIGFVGFSWRGGGRDLSVVLKTWNHSRELVKLETLVFSEASVYCFFNEQLWRRPLISPSLNPLLWLILVFKWSAGFPGDFSNVSCIDACVWVFFFFFSFLLLDSLQRPGWMLKVIWIASINILIVWSFALYFFFLSLLIL